MTFVLDLFIGQLRYQLHGAEGADAGYQLLHKIFGHDISFEKPEEVEMLEFRQQVFTIILVVVEIVDEGGSGLAVFEYGEIIVPGFLVELYLDLVVDPEVVAQQLIELPAELVVLYRRYNAQQAGIVEEVICEIVEV